MKKIIVYLAVTDDILSLPIALFDNLYEIGIWENCSIKEIKQKIKLKIKSQKNNCFFIKVELLFLIFLKNLYYRR